MVTEHERNVFCVSVCSQVGFSFSSSSRNFKIVQRSLHFRLPVDPATTTCKLFKRQTAGPTPVHLFTSRSFVNDDRFSRQRALRFTGETEAFDWRKVSQSLQRQKPHWTSWTCFVGRAEGVGWTWKKQFLAGLAWRDCEKDLRHCR